MHPPRPILDPDRAGCDADHTTPWAPRGRGGPTCTCQLVPLCRSHHRHKTHAGWSITVVEPGTYHWTSPHGLTGSAATTPAPNPSTPTPHPAVPPGRD